MHEKLENYIHIPIRKIKIVFDLDDVFKPELSLEDFIKINHENPHPPRYKIISIEVITCIEDQQPILISECGQCPKFVRRIGENICCRRSIDSIKI